MQSQNPSYAFQWVNTASDIEPSAWRECFDTRLPFLSQAMHLALEQSQFTDMTYYYLQVKLQGQVVAILPCFRYAFNLSALADDKTKKVVNKIKVLFPTFLKVNMFVMGPSIATCTHCIGINEQAIDAPNRADLLGQAVSEAEKKAKEAGAKLTVLKEFRHEFMSNLTQVQSMGYSTAESPATSYVYTGELEGDHYIRAKRAKYRNLMQARKRDFDKVGLRWERATDFGPHASAMHALYANVLNKAEVKFESLTPEFFKQVNEKLGDESFAQLCFDGDKLVAFELFLQGKELHPIYLGMDYDYLKSANLYYNCLYKIIEESQEQEMFMLELGQTSYMAKMNIGAVVEKLFILVKHQNPILNAVIRKFKDTLFPPTEITLERNIFRAQKAYMNIIEAAGIRYESPNQERDS